MIGMLMARKVIIDMAEIITPNVYPNETPSERVILPILKVLIIHLAGITHKRLAHLIDDSSGLAGNCVNSNNTKHLVPPLIEQESETR